MHALKAAAAKTTKGNGSFMDFYKTCLTHNVLTMAAAAKTTKGNRSFMDLYET